MPWQSALLVTSPAKIDAFAAFLPDHCQGRLGVPLVPVHQQYTGPLPGEQYRNGLSDAHEIPAAGGAGASDNGDLAAQAASVLWRHICSLCTRLNQDFPNYQIFKILPILEILKS